jgi:hypothetical protein
MSSSLRTPTISKEDTKKIGLLKQLNQILESFAEDASFQLDLQKPMVRTLVSPARPCNSLGFFFIIIEVNHCLIVNLSNI